MSAVFCSSFSTGISDPQRTSVWPGIWRKTAEGQTVPNVVTLTMANAVHSDAAPPMREDQDGSTEGRNIVLLVNGYADVCCDDWIQVDEIVIR